MLDAIRDWLLTAASRELETEIMLVQFIERLREAGVGAQRMSLSVRTLHPEVFVDNYIWTLEAGMDKAVRPNSLLEGRRYQESPVVEIHRGVDEVRVRLPDEAERYPLTRELAEEGFCDYVIFALPGGPHRSFVSFATRDAAGFDAHLEGLRERVIPALSLRIELASQRSATTNLLRTYLGPNAAKRVLDGAFRRGQGERIDAVIWTCDLRGFTSLVDSAPIDEVLPTLDRYFECVADPIAAHGGEVLKFIGDAVLAIFVDADVCRACAAALDAASDAFAALAELNTARAESGRPGLAFGVALHVGEVTYGNIGATGRLDFTVIGRAVNEVTRVESLCKVLGERLLLTESFAAACRRPELRSLGRHALRGVGEPIELLTLDAAPGARAQR